MRWTTRRCGCRIMCTCVACTSEPCSEPCRHTASTRYPRVVTIPIPSNRIPADRPPETRGTLSAAPACAVCTRATIWPPWPGGSPAGRTSEGSHPLRRAPATAHRLSSYSLPQTPPSDQIRRSAAAGSRTSRAAVRAASAAGTAASAAGTAASGAHTQAPRGAALGGCGQGRRARPGGGEALLLSYS